MQYRRVSADCQSNHRCQNRAFHVFSPGLQLTCFNREHTSRHAPPCPAASLWKLAVVSSRSMEPLVNRPCHRLKYHGLSAWFVGTPPSRHQARLTSIHNLNVHHRARTATHSATSASNHAPSPCADPILAPDVRGRCPRSPPITPMAFRLAIHPPAIASP